MNTIREKITSIRFEPHEWAKIEALAKSSGRPRGDVVRRLVEYALPEARRVLGSNDTEVKNDQRTTS